MKEYGNHSIFTPTDECGCALKHSHAVDQHVHDYECGCGYDEHPQAYGDGCGQKHSHNEHQHTSGDECGCRHAPSHAVHQDMITSAENDSNSAGKKVYILENLGCANCAAKMETKIKALAGVESATITFATKQLRLAADNYDGLLPQIQGICASIESEIKVVPRYTQPSREESAVRADKNKDHSLAFILGGAALLIVGKVMESQSFGTNFILSVYLVAYIILGGEIVLTALKNLIKGQIFDENFLMSIATLGAFAIKDYPEAVGVMLFFRVGEYFEEKAVERSRSQIMEAVDMRPEVVNLVNSTEIKAIPAADAKPGDILLVRPGDRIPLDGVIMDGESRIDTSAITGEPVPVSAKAGDKVVSGCVNTSGQLKMQVEKPLEESMVTRILDSVENAAASKPKIDHFITRFARIYTPVVVAVAIATAVIPSLFTGNWNQWIYTALSFLVISCPCALVLSVPLAFFCGIGAGSKKGILFKGGVSLEALQKVSAVVMDKTGTVTEGNFVLQQVVPVNGMDEHQLLQIAASLEQHSTHPIGVSIVTAAKDKQILLRTPENLEEISGHGLYAKIANDEILCGNRRLMEKYHIDFSDYRKTAFGAEVLIAVNGKFEGHLIVSDTIKANAAPAVSRLKKAGVITAMLTGDGEKSAKAIADVAGIQEVHAKLLPEDKVNKLKAIREKHGAVMFVGDGINDAPVLAAADVGAAMGSGADAAIEAADVVYMTSSMEAVPQSFAIAKSTGQVALQNVIFALVIKVIVMILGLCGFASMWLAVFADTGVAFLCILNSIRILYKQ